MLTKELASLTVSVVDLSTEVMVVVGLELSAVADC